LEEYITFAPGNSSGGSGNRISEPTNRSTLTNEFEFGKQRGLRPKVGSLYAISNDLNDIPRSKKRLSPSKNSCPGFFGPF
jgi:hypothetical protein